MATAEITESKSIGTEGVPTAELTHTNSQTIPIANSSRPRRRSTKQFKANPEPRALRERLKAEAYPFVERHIDRTRPFSRDQLEKWSRQFLQELHLEEKYLGFAMVMLGNAFWKDQFAAVPYNRRLLLLPHCLKHAEGCPADYDQFGLDCRRCGACSIADFKTKAEDLGYKVLVAEGTPIVLKIIVSGYVDAILGVACLNVLEKSIDKLLLAGIPAYAIPLHSGDCKNTSLDQEWVLEILDHYQPLPSVSTRTYVPLLRVANRMFDEHFDRLVPTLRTPTGTAPQTDPANTTVQPVSRLSEMAVQNPIAGTEMIARDWLRRGGKRFRPFLTLAVYDAMKGAPFTERGKPEDAVQFSDSVYQVALAMETFHKASLVHDDIEDDDAFRYGYQTLHRRYGLANAINIGDYLIGLGYRQVLAAGPEFGGAVVADIAQKLAEAHLRLCEGQGAELLWRQSPTKAMLQPLEVLKIYALKTAPAFEVAVYAGLRLAGPVGQLQESMAAFARHLGIGFQILNDLKDWQGDDANKKLAGQDALAMRPTLLLAFALESANPTQRAELLALLQQTERDWSAVQRLRHIFEQTGAFDNAYKLIDKNKQRAEAIADQVEPTELRELLYFVVDNILAEENPEVPVNAPLSLPILSITS